MKLNQVVGSSHVATHGYDSENLIFRIGYADGAVWDYLGVSHRVNGEFLAAESKGKFLHAHILGKYEQRKVRGSEPKK
jgi:hypothetical protein